MTTAEKYQALLERLERLDSVLVAYSGGVDSTLLAFAAHAVLGDRCTAVLATSDTYPEREAVAARELARSLGFRLIEVETSELADPRFSANAPDRCYHCKTELFGLLQKVAEVRGWLTSPTAATPTTSPTTGPGRRAAGEHHVVSPLADVGLTKLEIRELARELTLPELGQALDGVPRLAVPLRRSDHRRRPRPGRRRRERARSTWGCSSSACARTAPSPASRSRRTKLEHAWSMRAQIAEAVRAAGFAYAAFDLDGYRSGSMNEVLAESERESAAR